MIRKRQIGLCILLGAINLVVWGLREYYGTGLYGYLRFAPPVVPYGLSVGNGLIAFFLSYISLLLNWISFFWFALLLFKPAISRGVVLLMVCILLLLICIDVTLLKFRYVLFFLLGFPCHIYFLFYIFKNRRALTTVEPKEVGDSQA